MNCEDCECTCKIACLPREMNADTFCLSALSVIWRLRMHVHVGNSMHLTHNYSAVAMTTGQLSALIHAGLLLRSVGHGEGMHGEGHTLPYKLHLQCFK